MSASVTLAERGYASTGVREIAQDSGFSHGVLHYYFEGKSDLIACCVEHCMSRWLARFDGVVAAAGEALELKEAVCSFLADVVADRAGVFRLWYDVRNQSLFDESLRAKVVEVDKRVQQSFGGVICRYSRLTGRSAVVSDEMMYAAFDGLVQRALFDQVTRAKGTVPLLGESFNLLFEHLVQ